MAIIRKRFMILREELFADGRGFCISSGPFLERLKNLVELSEVKTRSASFSVLLTDLHGALTERLLRWRIT